VLELPGTVANSVSEVEKTLVKRYSNELDLSEKEIQLGLRVARTSAGIGLSMWMFKDFAIVEPLHLGKEPGIAHLCQFARLIIPSERREYRILQTHFEALWGSSNTEMLW
jgi:hypothetical protein